MSMFEHSSALIHIPCVAPLECALVVVYRTECNYRREVAIVITVGNNILALCI